MKQSKHSTHSQPDTQSLSVQADSHAGEQTVEIAAVRLLARREHSSQELKRKLLGKGYAEATVATVIAKLSHLRLVSDQRFVTEFIQYHARRGQGPVRIRAELRERGVADELVNAELKTAGCDWMVLAADVRQRRFGAKRARNLTERAKQARFLQYRGFNSDQIRAALAADVSDTEAGIGADPDPDC